MHKFDKILVQIILCCSLDAYLTMVMSDHFILCTLEINVTYCWNFIKFIMIKFFVYMLVNY